MNKTASGIIIGGLVLSIGIVLFGQSSRAPETGVVAAPPVEVRDGVQYVTIRAQGGYSPRVTTAQANMPTKLIMETNGTYDCSASLVIRSIGYQNILPQSGQEVIDLGTPKPGKLEGLCSMGMYGFSINFK